MQERDSSICDAAKYIKNAIDIPCVPFVMRKEQQKYIGKGP